MTPHETSGDSAPPTNFDSRIAESLPPRHGDIVPILSPRPCFGSDRVTLPPRRWSLLADGSESFWIERTLRMFAEENETGTTLNEYGTRQRPLVELFKEDVDRVRRVMAGASQSVRRQLGPILKIDLDDVARKPGPKLRFDPLEEIVIQLRGQGVSVKRIQAIIRKDESFARHRDRLNVLRIVRRLCKRKQREGRNHPPS